MLHPLRASLLTLLLAGLCPAVGLAQSTYDPDQPYLAPPPAATSVPTQPTEVPEPTALPSPREVPAPAPQTVPENPPVYTPPPSQTRTPPPRPVPQEEPAGRVDTGIPDFAIGLDPVDFIFEGKFAPLLEVKLWKFISLELAPLFFIDDSPLVFDIYGFTGRKEGVYRRSDGIGPLVGARLSVAFWLSRRPFRGLFLRPFISNYGIEYESKDGGVVVDRATFVERRLGALFGTMQRFGPLGLTLALGVSYELNGAQRCELDTNGPLATPRSSDCGQRFTLYTGGEPADVFGPLHPFALEGRIAVSIVLD